MLQTPLAYQYVVTLAMISQVNYYALRMHLPINVPVKEQDIRFLNASRPNNNRYSARIQVKNYSFTFSGESLSIYNLADDGLQSFGIPMELGESSRSGMERASRMRYIVSTNDVYRMATNWLVALDIDLEKLEAANPPCVNKYPIFHSERGLVPNPLLIVDWKNTNAPGYDPTEVTVEISAVSGELLKLTDSGSFGKRGEQPLIKDLNNLLAISDEQFLKYSTLERSNLVVRFTSLHCSDLHCPGVDDPISPETNAVSHVSQITNSTAKQN